MTDELCGDCERPLLTWSHPFLTGTTAGGQTLTLTGSGFLPGGTDVTMCGLTCPAVTGSTTATELCVTPANSGRQQEVVTSLKFV